MTRAQNFSIQPAPKSANPLCDIRFKQGASHERIADPYACILSAALSRRSFYQSAPALFPRATKPVSGIRTKTLSLGRPSHQDEVWQAPRLSDWMFALEMGGRPISPRRRFLANQTQPSNVSAPGAIAQALQSQQLGGAPDDAAN